MVYKNGLISLALSSALVMSMTGCDADATKDTSKQKDVTTNTVTNNGKDKEVVTTTNNNDTSAVTTNNNTTDEANFQQTTAHVLVAGLVQDAAGNAIADAKVYLLNQETTTNLGGVYTFDNVPAINVLNANGVNIAQPLLIKVDAGSNFLNGTVKVFPQAQLVDSDQNGTETQVTFIDGQSVQAGSAVLPALNATVTGRLENKTTEAPIVGATVILTPSVLPTHDHNATTFGYNAYQATAITDALGSFTVENAPSGISLTYVVDGYASPTQETAGNDLDETNNSVVVAGGGVVTNTGDVQVTLIGNDDNVSPAVWYVKGILTNAARATLDDDTRGRDVVATGEGITGSNAHHKFDIYFTEALDTTHIDNNSVIVKAAKLATPTSPESVVSTVIVVSDNHITVELADEVSANNAYIDIHLLQSDFQDKAGIKNINGENNFITNSAAISYDNTPINKTLKLQLQTYAEINQEASAITAFSQLAVDSTQTTDLLNDLGDLQAANNAFTDVNDSGTPDKTISQLNSYDVNSDTADRLTLLAIELKGAGSSVRADEARIQFTPAGAFEYDINVTRGSSLVGVALGAITGATSNVNITTAYNSSIKGSEFNLTDGNVVEFVLNDVRPGDVVTITPADELGYAGNPASITLADNVAPTTVLQKSYHNGATTSGNNGSGAVAAFGQGGELSDIAVNAAVGTPYLGINPGLLDNLTSANLVASGAAKADKALTKELLAHNVIDTTQTPNVAYIIEGKNTYDQTAYDVFEANLARKVGVAFSEPVALGTSSTSFLSGLVTVSEINNGVAVQVNDNINERADLINLNVTDVMALANDNDDAVIDFVGITDTATVANIAIATSNAKVVINDEMPPMVTEAEYDGEGVIITFNESIVLYDDLNVTLGNGAAKSKATLATVAGAGTNWVLSDSGTLTDNVLTISVDQFVSTNWDLNDTADWVVGGDAANYAEGTSTNITDMEHGELNTSLVRDSRNNSWESYKVATEDNDVAYPMFAIRNTVEDFGLTSTTTTGFSSSDGTSATTHTVTWVFNAPLTMQSNLFATAVEASGIRTLTGAAAKSILDTNLTLEVQNGNGGAGTFVRRDFNATGLQMTLASDRKTLTMTFGIHNVNDNNGSRINFSLLDDINSSYDFKSTDNALSTDRKSVV